MLLGLGVTLIVADSTASFLDDGPTSKLIRQILGAVAEFDKAMTVAKLKGARNRVRRRAGKCEGRKSYTERDPALVAAQGVRGICRARLRHAKRAELLCQRRAIDVGRVARWRAGARLGAAPRRTNPTANLGRPGCHASAHRFARLRVCIVATRREPSSVQINRRSPPRKPVRPVAAG
jgi:DNA invertase Pin-like site-specific DNA recombinase